MNKFAVAAVLAVAILCIGLLAVCANGGHAVAVKPKPKPKQTPYGVCLAKHKAWAKKGDLHYGQWAKEDWIMKNNNRDPDTGKPILSPKAWANQVKTCDYAKALGY